LPVNSLAGKKLIEDEVVKNGVVNIWPKRLAGIGKPYYFEGLIR
jgi:hypothetical protein